MSLSARDYLLDRFRSDAIALRQRAESLPPGGKVAGPDAAMSRKMASACDDVVAMLQAMATNGDARATVEALMALVPLLEQRANAAASAPPVRAVYAGAATRIREVRDAELASRAPGDSDAESMEDDLDDRDYDESDADDEDADDDDLPPLRA